MASICLMRMDVDLAVANSPIHRQHSFPAIVRFFVGISQALRKIFMVNFCMFNDGFCPMLSLS